MARAAFVKGADRLSSGATRPTCSSLYSVNLTMNSNDVAWVDLARLDAQPSLMACTLPRPSGSFTDTTVAGYLDSQAEP